MVVGQSARSWIQLAAVVALAATMTRGQTSPIGVPHFAPPTPQAEVNAAAASSATSTVPYWSSSFVSGGKTYAYSMVGANPRTSPSKSTTVNTEIQPIAFKFSNGTVIHASTAAIAIANSPIFVNTKFPTGTGQFGDIIQRANFWKYVVYKPYHVLLGLPSIRSEIVISVPKTSGSTDTSKTGTPYGLVDYDFVEKTVTNLVKTGNFHPASLPIFVAGNIFEYQQVDVLCCVLGYHNALALSGGRLQTYIYTSYPSSGLFGAGFQDTAVLSHEVAEWINDPFGTNVVRPWSTPKKPGYCFSNLLEVGDPIEDYSNANYTVTLNGKTYHVQDVAFFSWFSGDTPSIGAGGRYSYAVPAKFTKHSAFCN
jgi:hypothetical protein